MDKTVDKLVGSNVSSVLQHEFKVRVLALLETLKPSIAALGTAEAYFALDSGFIANPTDTIELVRYSAVYQYKHKVNEMWAKGDPAVEYVKYIPITEPHVDVTIEVGSLGIVRIAANKVTTTGLIDLSTIQYESEIVNSTLYHVEVMQVIDQIVAKNLLSEPTLVKHLT